MLIDSAISLIVSLLAFIKQNRCDSYSPKKSVKKSAPGVVERNSVRTDFTFVKGVNRELMPTAGGSAFQLMNWLPILFVFLLLLDKSV
ncbi:hypothetical protein P3TCK_21655 [Photobacterium profundum 3TCK]|uniref:Uncharacterized protein n=1 Tax=Photobacterium profundum 3TCK TaxID=314280 RepID=Q1Z8H5_9GAMM|nr:hypothetical protein P3TCK_21655 [Photobacterium profundum 3TCK]